MTHKTKRRLGSSLPAFEALNFKPWVRKYSVDLDRTAFHPFSMLVCGGKFSHIKYHNLWRQPTEVVKLSTIGYKNRKTAALLKLQSISFESKLSAWGPCWWKAHNRITPDLATYQCGGQSLIGYHFFVLRFRGSMNGFSLELNPSKNCLEETQKTLEE